MTYPAINVTLPVDILDDILITFIRTINIMFNSKILPFIANHPGNFTSGQKKKSHNEELPQLLLGEDSLAFHSLKKTGTTMNLIKNNQEKNISGRILNWIIRWERLQVEGKKKKKTEKIKKKIRKKKENGKKKAKHKIRYKGCNNCHL